MVGEEVVRAAIQAVAGQQVVSGAQEAELAELVCFLCSAAGEYFSGCRLELGKAPD